MKTLYLFVTSDRPDPYLNSVAHCNRNVQIEAVEYISVRYPDDKEQRSGALAKQVSTRVTVLLEELVNDSTYKKFPTAKHPSERIDLHPIYSQEKLTFIRELYRPCLGLQYRDVDIPWSELREKIRSLALSRDAIVDITSARKRLLGDILAASVVEGLDRLYTFELKEKEDHDSPWKNLLHERLPFEEGYVYVNLVETDVFKACSRSILVRPPYLKLVFWAATALWAATATLVFFYGDNWVAKWSSIISAAPSLLSLGYALFSVHRK